MPSFSLFHNLFLALVMNWGDVKQCLEKFFEFETKACFLTFNHSYYTFIAGLAASQVSWYKHFVVHERPLLALSSSLTLSSIDL